MNDLQLDGLRYRKLREWMSSNVKEGWKEIENLSSIYTYVGFSEGDAYLDYLPDCNVGLWGDSDEQSI